MAFVPCVLRSIRLLLASETDYFITGSQGFIDPDKGFMARLSGAYWRQSRT